MATLDQVLKLLIQADAKGLSAGLSKATGELKNFGGMAQRTFSGISSAFAALGVTLSTGAFAVSIKNIIDGFDQLNDASQQLGVGTAALSELGYAAEQSGSSIEELQSGLKFLNKNLIEARDGNKQLATTFRQYGITALDDTESALAKLADAFAAMPDGARKTNAALELLGRGGIKLIPFLNNGAAGLAKLREEAVKLGISIGSETALAADAFNDQLNTIGNRIKGVGTAIAVDALPYLSQLSKSLADVAREGGSVVSIIGKLAEEIEDLFRFGQGESGLTKALDEEKAKLAEAEAAVAKYRRIRDGLEEESFGSRARRAITGQSITEQIEAWQEVAGKARVRIGDLNTKLAEFSAVQKDAASSADALAKIIQYAGPLARLTAEEIASLSVSYKRLIADIKEARKDALASPLKDVKDSSVLTINRLKDDAQKALEGGDAEAAERLIKQAKAVNDYLLETKQISKSYYDTQAAAILKLAEQGQAVIDSGEALKLPVAPDLESAKNTGILAWDAAQAAVNARGPIIIPGVVQVGGSAFTDEAGATTDGRVNISAAGVYGYASGGAIRGPGTGLSDSILARLSAGEFVVKAAAVKNYGLGFLQRLNSMSLPRFASGGPVGTPINIHLDGRSYPMQAQPSVAKELGRLLGNEVLKRGRR